MTFCHHNYKQYGIECYTIKEWCDMVNDNRRYCKNFTRWKWFVLYFWVFVGRVKYCQLPSFHPYWLIESKKDVKKRLDQTVVKYNECVSNPKIIKYHFNASTTLQDIKERIERYKRELR